MRLNLPQTPVVYGLIGLAVSLVLTLTGYRYNERVLESSRIMAAQSISAEKATSELKTKILYQQRILHSLAATNMRRALIEEYQRNHQDCLDALATLDSRISQGAGVDKIHREQSALKSLFNDFATASMPENLGLLGTKSSTLEIASTAENLVKKLDDLESRFKAKRIKNFERYQQGIIWTRTLLVLASASTFLVLLSLGFYIRTSSEHQAKLERLASFPKTNPRPVVMLSSTGALIYANQRAYDLAKTIGGKEGEIHAILPADIDEKLRELKDSSSSERTWEYPREEFILACTAHYLPNHDRFHLFLADITERKKTEKELIRYVFRDTLTDLPNRRSFNEHFERRVESKRTKAQSIALFLIGIDRFKYVTGSFGHETGDKLIQAVAMRLKEIIEKEFGHCERASLFRFEGDVFALLIIDFQRYGELEKLAQVIMEEIQSPFFVRPRQFFLTVSCGISICVGNSQDSISLIRNAETAMQQAKLKGGNNLSLYSSDMKTVSAESLSLGNYLRHAVRHDELQLFYQPQIDVETEKVVGAEALLRWNHPGFGRLTPDRFIPIAEETGIVHLISEWIIRTACRQSKVWQSQGLGDMTIAINISTRQFLQPNLRNMVERVLTETGLEPRYLELEITESIAVQDLLSTQLLLNDLKRTGISLSIDDFGTGYSSLSYIKHFPVDKIKVDQSFINELTSDPYDAAITKAIVTLGKNLGLTIVAEGVETRDQFDWLKQAGCDQVQGHVFAKPVAKDEFERFLRTNVQRNRKFRN